jgi:hypothetical protein
MDDGCPTSREQRVRRQLEYFDRIDANEQSKKNVLDWSICLGGGGDICNRSGADPVHCDYPGRRSQLPPNRARVACLLCAPVPGHIDRRLA